MNIYKYMWNRYIDKYIDRWIYINIYRIDIQINIQIDGYINICRIDRQSCTNKQCIEYRPSSYVNLWLISNTKYSYG